MQFLVSRATAHERQPMKLRAQVPAPAVDEERVFRGDLVDPQEAERDYPAGCRGPGAARHFAHFSCPLRHLVATDRRDVRVHAQAEEFASHLAHVGPARHDLLADIAPFRETQGEVRRDLQGERVLPISMPNRGVPASMRRTSNESRPMGVTSRRESASQRSLRLDPGDQIAKPSSPSPRTRRTWPSWDLSIGKVMKASCGSARGSAVRTPETRSPAAGPCTSMCPTDPRSWNSTSSLTRAFSMSWRIASFCAASMSRTSESANAYTRVSPSTRLFSFSKSAYADIPGVRIFRSAVTSPSRNGARSEPLSRIFARSPQSIIPARPRTARTSSSIQPA